VETSSRGRNALLTAIGVLAAIVLVAIAARGSTSAGGGATRAPSDALMDVLFTAYLVAIVGGAALFVYLLMLRKNMKVEGGLPRRRSVLEMLATMFVMAAAGTLIARRLGELERPTLPPVQPEEAVGTVGTLPATTGPAGSSYEPGVAWIPVLVTTALILVAIAAWWYAGRARRRARGELQPELAAAVAEAVDQSLDDLRAEPDPRRAVIAAYARLERVLAGHGLPRKPAEAPLEYLGRMLTELSVSDRAARALTELFERAKFSQHAVGSEMKEQAIDALETVRDDLLAAQALAEQARRAAIDARREQAASG
jgi:hypothetical protein